MGMQQSNIAVQRCLPNRDVPVGTAVIFFFQTFGGALFMSVAQNTFLTKFVHQLSGVHGVNPAVIGQTGATSLRDAVPPELLPQVLQAYNYAVTQGPFFVSMITGCLSIFGALGMEWLSVKDKNPDDVPEIEPVKDVEAGSIEEDSASRAKNGAAEEKSTEAQETQNAPNEGLNELESKEVS
jgi:hypothetical protein